MIVFLYRPSPQVSEPSEQAAEKCFEASTLNVNMQSTQIANRSVDLTWIFTQALFMALNTILWSLSYPTIRRKHPIDEVKVYLQQALEAIDQTSERWPGVQSALQLYENLIQGCLKAYSSTDSFVIRSLPSAQGGAMLSPPDPSLSPASPAASSLAAPSLAAHQSPQSHYESCGESSTDYHNPAHSSPSQADTLGYFGEHELMQTQSNISQEQSLDISHLQSAFQSSLQQSPISPMPLNGHEPQWGLPIEDNYGMPNFNPHSVENELPSTIPGLPQWDPSIAFDSSQPAFPGYNDIAMDMTPWLGSFGDEYSRYTHQAYDPPPQQIQSLSEQQQLELMAALEQDQLPDVSALTGDAATSYTGNVL
jgi:hypothetical protein